VNVTFDFDELYRRTRFRRK